MITEAELKKLKELCEKATENRWSIDEGSIHDNGDEIVCCVSGPLQDDCYFKLEDAQFIAEARSAMPLLIEEVERLQKLQKTTEVIMRSDMDIPKLGPGDVMITPNNQTELEQENKKLQMKNQLLEELIAKQKLIAVEALEFYAEELSDVRVIFRVAIHEDCGTKAKEALEKLK